jgi:hypothetical protein
VHYFDNKVGDNIDARCNHEDIVTCIAVQIYDLFSDVRAAIRKRCSQKQNSRHTALTIQNSSKTCEEG